MDGFEVVAAVLMSPQKPISWARGQPVPMDDGKAVTKIERILIVGDAVDVFVHQSNGAQQVGMHIRFPSPKVMYTVEQADRGVWQVDAQDEDGEYGRDFRVLMDAYGSEYIVNQPLPNAPATVTRIVLDEFGIARLYALPNPGTQAARDGNAYRITFFPNTGFFVRTEGLPITEWMDLQEEVEIEAAGEEEEPADPDDPEIEPAGEPAAEVNTNGAIAAEAPPAPPSLPQPPPPPAMPGIG